MLISGCGQSFCTCATVRYQFNSLVTPLSQNLELGTVPQFVIKSLVHRIHAMAPCAGGRSSHMTLSARASIALQSAVDMGEILQGYLDPGSIDSTVSLDPLLEEWTPPGRMDPSSPVRAMCTYAVSPRARTRPATKLKRPR